MNNAIYWFDSKSRFIDVNETACNTLGYSREEFLDMSVSDIDTDINLKGQVYFLSKNNLIPA